MKADIEQLSYGNIIFYHYRALYASTFSLFSHACTYYPKVCTQNYIYLNQIIYICV